jgi:hypothetical protein
MKFDESEFKKMRYNIRKYAEDDEVLWKFPDLLAYQSVFLANDLGNDLDPDFVLRYLIYLFDLGSPAQSIPDLKRRKAYVMSVLGKDLENLTKAEQDMMRWKNKGVNKRAIIFLLLVGGEHYFIWKREEEKLMQIGEKTIELDGSDINEKKKAAETEKIYSDLIKLSIAQMTEARDKFLQGEKEKELQEELTSFTLSDSLGIRPEEYIRKREQDGDVFTDVDH